MLLFWPNFLKVSGQYIGDVSLFVCMSPTIPVKVSALHKISKQRLFYVTILYNIGDNMMTFFSYWSSQLKVENIVYLYFLKIYNYYNTLNYAFKI